jgi:hypothetical protein
LTALHSYDTALPFLPHPNIELTAMVFPFTDAMFNISDSQQKIFLAWQSKLINC